MRLAVPYDRAADKLICHIGVGNFHRAHQAVYLDHLRRNGLADGWSICGINLLESDRPLIAAMQAQDCLYTVCEKQGDAYNLTVIGSIIEMVDAISEAAPALRVMIDPRCHVVSLTVTEKGYWLGPDNALDLSAPAIQQDLNQTENPRTAIGMVVRALAQRMASGAPPFTVMSCDNIPGNGAVLRRAVLQFAELLDASLAQWIREEVAFPSTMVDRITPAADQAHRIFLAKHYGVHDQAPVMCESWLQWVIEDWFTGQRPPFEQAGVQFSNEVHHFEAMKIGLLNGSHSALAHAGLFMGYKYVDEAAAQPAIVAWLRAYMKAVIPSLELPTGIDVQAYCNALLERFANAGVRDVLCRLAEDSSSKYPLWVGPPLLASFKGAADCTPALSAIAFWILYLVQMDGDARADYRDKQRDELISLARTATTSGTYDQFLQRAMKFPVPVAHSLAQPLERLITQIGQAENADAWLSARFTD